MIAYLVTAHGDVECICTEEDVDQTLISLRDEGERDAQAWPFPSYDEACHAGARLRAVLGYRL